MARRRHDAGSPRRRSPACRSTTGPCSRPPSTRSARSPRSAWPSWRASTRPRSARTSRTSAPTAPGASATTSSTCCTRSRRELGLTHDWPVAIVGIGNLGRALANYRGFGARGFRVVALVDADPEPVGRAGRRPARSSRSTTSPRIVAGARDRDRHHRHARRASPRRWPTGSSPPASARSSTSRRRCVTVPDGRVAAQGRPRDRAADPVLLPTAARRRAGADGRDATPQPTPRRGPALAGLSR